jgi:putative addiction module killer protein
MAMYTVKTTSDFDNWLSSLKDARTRIRLARRLERVRQGNLGDVASVGDSVFEMREFFGPGWHMYYCQHENTLIVMLGGGDKSTQAKDIAKAKRVAHSLRK